MPKDDFKYIVIGGGLAGASAVEGIREKDTDGSIAMLANEEHLPYDRPPLTKKLWTGKMSYGQVFLHDQKYYFDNNVEVLLGVTVTAIDPVRKNIVDSAGRFYHYEKLLLATGGRPRRLSITGGNLEGICYYRYLEDYRRISNLATAEKSAVIVGGGFIGSELAASLSLNGIKVSMIFPGSYICEKVFPGYLASALQKEYVKKGIEIINGDKPLSFEKKNNGFVVHTENGEEIESDMLIVGIGINPEYELAATAKLRSNNGVVVNEYLQTSDPDIYAAGDNAAFPCRALGKVMRFEHWDNARSQGIQAGKNMAGAREPFDYLPYFFSDLFEFGYEAVGEVDSRFKTFAVWQEENKRQNENKSSTSDPSLQIDLDFEDQ